MKKPDKNIKRLKFIKGLAVFIVIQLILVFVLIYSRHINALVDSDDLKTDTVIVERTEYGQKPFVSGHTFIFYVGSTKYYFPKFAVSGTDECSMGELNGAIKTGDKITVVYVEEKDEDSGKKNKVLGAHSDTEVYRSVEAYNAFLKRQNTLGIVIFAVMEILLLSVLVIYTLFNCRMLNLFSRKSPCK